MSLRAATTRGLVRSPSAGVFSTVNEAFTPRSLPNLAAWFDALDTRTMLSGDGSTITDGGAVALWGDKSGNSGVNCLVLPGVASNYGSTPDIAIGPDLTVDADIRCPDYTPAADMSIFAKQSSDPNRTFVFWLLTTGVLRFQWFSTGSLASSANADSTVAVPFADYARGWVRVTIDVDNGSGGSAVKFYTSTDGSTWTQLGTTVSFGSTTAIADTTAQFEVGSRFGGGSSMFTGNVYRARVYSTFEGSGSPILDIDFSTAGKKLANGDTFVCATGQTVTLNSSGATGARIAGERDLFQGTLANRPVYLAYSGTKYGYLNGTSAYYFSTPDSAGVSVTGDIDLRAKIAPASWTANWFVLGKYNSVGNQKSYYLYVVSSGVIRLGWSADGAADLSADSTAATGFAANSTHWIRATMDVDNGAGSRVINFYTSDDGSTWTQLGNTVTVAATTSIFDSTATLAIGGYDSGTLGTAAGRVYNAQVYDGIGGTLKADFNPALYSSGTTFTASTGEVWTINGGAHIVTRTGLYFNGSSSSLKMAAANISQPETVYLTGDQITWSLNRYVYDGNATNSGILIQQTGTPKVANYAGSGFTGDNSDWTLKTSAMIASVLNGASSSTRVNRRTATTGSVGTGNLGGFTLGNAASGSSQTCIFVSEVAIYSAAHPASIWDRMALYEGRKHGFSV